MRDLRENARSAPEREVVQSLWVGPRLSPLERCSIRSFLAHGHPYHLYVYDDVEGVPEGTVLMPAGDVLPVERVFTYKDFDSVAGFSDIFRYRLLHLRGGYWADADVVCLRPLDLTAPFVFATQRNLEGRLTTATAVIKAPAGSELTGRAYETASCRDPETLQWGEIGPELLTQLVDELGLRRYATRPSAFCPIDWWRWKRALDDSWSTHFANWLSGTRRAYAVHLWNEMWRRAGADKHATYPRRSLYERLKKRYA